VKYTKAENFTTDYFLKSDCCAARQRHREFWSHGSLDAPLLHIKAIKEGYSKVPDDQNKSQKELQLDSQWHINLCRSQILAYDFLFDSMPLAVVMFGRDITNMGVLSGSDFDISSVTEFINFKNNPDFLFAPTPEFDPESPFVQSVLEVYRQLHAEVGQSACLNPPTTADAMTTMAMVMGMEDFLISLTAHQSAVKRKAAELNSLFYSFYDYIYQYLLQWGYGEAASWFPVFAEGRFDSVRSDVSVMLSEKMFKEFSVPVLSEACSCLDYAMFNLDSVDMIRFLDALLEIKALNGVYWNIEPWLCSIEEYLPVLKRIKESGMLLALPCSDASQASIAINGLGKSGLLLEFPVFEDREKAISTGQEITGLARGCLY
jgi:hypothetical protein